MFAIIKTLMQISCFSRMLDAQILREAYFELEKHYEK